MSGKLMFQMSADASFIWQRLKTAKVGDVISYEELSKIVDRKVEGSTTALRTAVSRCLKDDHMVFGTVRGEGVKRLADQEIIRESSATAIAIKRKAERGVERLTTLNDFSALPEAQKRQYTARVSVMAAVAHMTSSTQIAKVETSIKKGEKNQLPIADTLKMFS